MKKILLIASLLTVSAYSFASVKDCATAATSHDKKLEIEYCTPYLKDEKYPEATAILAAATPDYKQSLNYASWYVNYYEKNNSLNTTDAESTYTNILNMMGNIYYFGQAGKPDKAKGLEYITKAANLGNAFAQYQLGGMYQSGQNGEITRDIATGYKWTEIAIANGSQKAKNGFLNVNLDGFKKQAPYCIAMGEQLVAQAYINGFAGLPKDNSKAKDYLNQAIDLYKTTKPTKANLKYCQTGADKLNLASAEKELKGL
ncbi:MULTISPECIES: tetratricopeptide repeat protein [unclassified Francisella]|uniref:tetratricopeptide repeat protein n=1 Tax=unclassified Francisella TaxID=2610885 RepID=UPI002E33A4D6|nr:MULTISPECIES: hypothetical protein [unclassified Francisella]MED7818500.1 hypothetical protein [Francisella sp. 19S2-4]MED7829336.1 hypothetical protein [Francisella sp. 19S2-10]